MDGMMGKAKPALSLIKRVSGVFFTLFLVFATATVARASAEVTLTAGESTTLYSSIDIPSGAGTPGYTWTYKLYNEKTAKWGNAKALPGGGDEITEGIIYVDKDYDQCYIKALKPGQVQITVVASYNFYEKEWNSYYGQYMTTNIRSGSGSQIWTITIEPAPATIIFDPVEGTCDVESKELYIDEAFGKLPVPVREGYKFLGWYTHKITGKLVDENTIAEESEITLYAHWEEAPTATPTPTVTPVPTASPTPVPEDKADATPKPVPTDKSGTPTPAPADGAKAATPTPVPAETSRATASNISSRSRTTSRSSGSGSSGGGGGGGGSSSSGSSVGASAVNSTAGTNPLGQSAGQDSTVDAPDTPGSWVQGADGSWNYKGADGANLLGWIVYGKQWYYLGENGIMLKGWQKIADKWYYFETEAGQNQGHMYLSRTTPDGYTVGADGSWQQG